MSRHAPPAEVMQAPIVAKDESEMDQDTERSTSGRSDASTVALLDDRHHAQHFGHRADCLGNCKAALLEGGSMGCGHMLNFHFEILAAFQGLV